MSKYICTAHHCGGSTSEAVDPQYIWGPFSTRSEALTAVNKFYGVCSTAYGNDWMFNIIKVPDPIVPTADVLAQYKKEYD